MPLVATNIHVCSPLPAASVGMLTCVGQGAGLMLTLRNP